MMLDNNKNQESGNFWISYADLMAGLLFVFILLIGAIVVKSVVLKSSLNTTQNKLLQSDKDLTNTKSILKLKNDEIMRLKELLLDKKTTISNLSKKIVILQTNIDKLDDKLMQDKIDIKQYKDKILILSNNLVDANNSIKLKDEQMLALLSKLNDKETKYEVLVKALQNTRKRIKNLTGIKIKVIGVLKEALGDRVSIDESGALRLSSNILFDKDTARLKDSAKKELEDIFIRYVKTLVVNQDIKSHLDKIIIEGHSDSDGEFIYNLNLSQQRALSVMNFLLSLDFAKKYDIKKYILASGRSYLDPILDKSGKEDKEASRRIEIKFLLKNSEAMKEIEKILGE